MKKGKFIVIDGTDGSGKTTQLELLKQYCESKKSIMTLDFPQYDKFWGKMVGRFLTGEFGELDEISPYLVSPLYLLDQQSKSKEIEDFLKKDNSMVLSNRYVTSSFIHQVAKFEDQQSQDSYRDWLEEAAYKNLKLFKEDVVIILYVPVDISKELALNAKGRKSYIKSKDIAEDHFEHQKKSSEIALQNCQRYNHWHLIECCEDGKILPKEKIHKKVVQLLTDLAVI